MKKLTLIAQKRTVLGEKVKNLRLQKIIPANVFGKKMKSLAIQIPLEKLTLIYHEAGETGLIDLTVDGQEYPVLIQNLQVHPVTRMPLHADLYHVDLKQKVKADVPLEITGSAPAVDQKVGILLELVDEVEVEALPRELPEKILLDVSKLEKLNDAIKVSDLVLPQGVEVLTDKNTELVKVGELVSKEAERLAAQEAAQKAAAVAEAAAVVPAATDAAATSAPKPEAAKETKPS